MLRRPLLSLLLAVVLAAIFVGGLVRLFALRYEVGDIYPEYSSLRADPLGTKALAAALAELPGIEVQRNFKPLPKLRPKGPVTLVYAGVPHHAYWNSRELLDFDTLVADGSRAIFTFYPVATPPAPNQDKQADDMAREKKEKKTGDEKTEAKKKTGDKKNRDKKPADQKKDVKSTPAEDEKSLSEEPPISFATVAKRWGFAFGYLPNENDKPYDRHAALVEPGGKMESDISWHSALYFKDLKPQWKVLYMCGTMPVIVERKYGNGSIVLVADSYPLSNEALRKERHSQLLSRLFSGPTTIVFDEEHNDVRENPGIATLVRKYRLHGVVGGLLLLALLFVWKNAVRFVPAYATSAAERDVIAGKESSEGFTNLLRRAITPSALLETCLAEWRKASSHKRRDLTTVEEIWTHEQTRPARFRDPIAIYRTISDRLARKG